MRALLAEPLPKRLSLHAIWSWNSTICFSSSGQSLIMAGIWFFPLSNNWALQIDFMSWKTTKEVEKNIKSAIMCLPERWHSRVFILTIVSVPYRKLLNSTPNPFINYEYTNARITPPSFFCFYRVILPRGIISLMKNNNTLLRVSRSIIVPYNIVIIPCEGSISRCYPAEVPLYFALQAAFGMLQGTNIKVLKQVAIQYHCKPQGMACHTPLYTWSSRRTMVKLQKQ